MLKTSFKRSLVHLGTKIEETNTETETKSSERLYMSL